MKNQFQLRKDYDLESDVLWLSIEDDYNYRESIGIGNVILDFDENCIPVAVEILDASKVLNLSKDSLKKDFNVKMDISLDEDLIAIHAQFAFPNKKQIPVEKDFKTVNDINIPSREVGMVIGEF
jgi:uncharacterized protein YuzE